MKTKQKYGFRLKDVVVVVTDNVKTNRYQKTPEDDRNILNAIRTNQISINLNQRGGCLCVFYA